MNYPKQLLPLLFLCFYAIPSSGQLTLIDHWETVVFETDTWHYFVGNSAPPSNWNQPSFMPSSWQTGQGGIGYDDGDDNTIISPTLSLFMRLDFNIIDTSKIIAAILHADYDDGFIAYLNGHEIARANIDGILPSHTDTALTWREAIMYQGAPPTDFLLLKDDLNQYLNQGTNTLAVQVHNHNISSSDMSSRFFFSVGLSDASTPYSPVPSWFTAPFIASNLPLIKINTNGQTIIEDIKITADMEVIDNGTGNLNYLDDVPNNYNGKIGIEIRGASSTGFEKKGFSVETRDAQGNNNNVQLLGMPSENDWVFHGPYADKTLIRNHLTYHIGRRLGRYASRTRLCEVFLNDNYWGVYLLKEKIKRDGDRVDIAKLTPADTLGDELTGGYIFKIDRDTGPDEGWHAVQGYGYYAYHHPSHSDLHPSQKAYIRNHFTAFENLMLTSNFNHPTIGYTQWIDVPSFIDEMLIQEITRNIDAYRLSAFLHKEKDSDGGKIYAGPIWDFNLGYGNEDFCDNGNSSGWAFQYNSTCGAPFPVWWGKLISDADFRDAFHCRWLELRSNVLHTDTIYQFIDSLVIVLDAAKDRNFNRWNVLGNYVWPNPFVGQNYPQEISYLKNWIFQRLHWIDVHMIGNGSNCATNTVEPSRTNFKVYPNPFQEYLFFETDATQPITIHLQDVLGRVVKIVHLEPHDSFYQMETADLETGVYFYSIYKEERLVKSGKVVHTP